MPRFSSFPLAPLKSEGNCILIDDQWPGEAKTIKMTPDFTLKELEEAQALIKELSHD